MLKSILQRKSTRSIETVSTKTESRIVSVDVDFMEIFVILWRQGETEESVEDGRFFEVEGVGGEEECGGFVVDGMACSEEGDGEAY